VLPTFADPKTDFVFKRIFGSEARKPLLIALLNDLLELEGAGAILDLEHLSGEQRVDLAELKLSIVDVKCTDVSGRRFVVEMQVLKVEGFEKRVVYNASKAYIMQLRSAEEYPTLCDVVGVTICDFKLWSEKFEGRFKVPMLSRWRMQEQHSGEQGMAQVQYAFLELPKYNAGDKPQTLVEKWAYFFREANSLEVVPVSLSDGPFRDALEVARTSSFRSEEWEAYERAKMAEQDARGALALAHREGVEEGHKSGVEEGHRSGVEEGHRSGVEEGHKSGKAAALLVVLAARGIAVSTEARARIEACREPSTLDLWIARATTVTSIENVFTVPE
jgi:predicted transposase/invertase (TIGR01784 family)